MRVFVYGTLLRPRLQQRLLGRPVPVQSAVLRGWARVGLRFTPYPTLRRGFRAEVAGAVLAVSARGLARLVAYEGPHYRFARVAVRRADGKTVPACAWIAPGATLRPWP